MLFGAAKSGTVGVTGPLAPVVYVPLVTRIGTGLLRPLLVTTTSVPVVASAGIEIEIVTPSALLYSTVAVVAFWTPRNVIVPIELKFVP
jgi:hypothetical protein